ncbi:hypothetical protein HDV06_005170 [Boothiomyces sp. JEL0866]|nr:hypothetical protein HDV06_005170 [Boothiomyces sp. JEL0866]
MERLIKLASAGLKEDTVYVLWSHMHRVTQITGNKAGRHYEYHCKIIDKYFVPGIISWYRMKSKVYTRDQSVRFDAPLKKYMQYDGQYLLEWNYKPKEKNEFEYKNTKYASHISDSIKNERKMKNWQNDSKSFKAKMIYETLHFLHLSGIDPTKPIQNGQFALRIKNRIINEWKQVPGNVKLVVYKGKEVQLVKDCLGLWTVDKVNKDNLKDVDCIATFDIEHIVSNSFGTDNNDHTNGVLLDSRINRTKGNMMLFLVGDDIHERVQQLKKQQHQFLKSLKPWYKLW